MYEIFLVLSGNATEYLSEKNKLVPVVSKNISRFQLLFGKPMHLL